MGNKNSNKNSNTNSNTKKTDKKKKAEIDVHEQYEFGPKIGEGATCRVIAGFDRKNKEKKLAIKVLEKKRKRSKPLYKRETNILSRIKHPNVAEYIDGREDDENFYVITRLYAGGDLFERMMDPQYKITENTASALIGDILKSVKHLHENGIVHRDIKPENFVFDEKKSDTNITLIDFGSAKIVSDNQEYPEIDKMLTGSVYYIAPELVGENKKLSKTGKLLKCSDLWSIGVLTYVMITGNIPFKGKTNKEYFHHIIHDNVVFPWNIEIKLSNAIKQFIRKLLIKDPFKRMTIDEALSHPFIKGLNDEDIQMNNEVIKYLEQYNYQSKLKKAVTKCLAKNMNDEAKVKKHFNRLDRNNKKYLDINDLHDLLLDIGYTESKSKIKAKLMLKAVDQNKDNKIDYDEFRECWQRKQLCDDVKYIQMVFNVFDKNKDGFVDDKELKRILNVYQGYIKEMIQEVDENNKGKISFEEFKKAMLEHIYPSKTPIKSKK